MNRMICYVATHVESGKRYVGITKRTLNVRKRQHENYAKRGSTESRLYEAIRKYGNDAFNWEIVAEGRDEVIKLLERTLINTWDTNRYDGFNTQGPEVPPDVGELFPGHDWRISVLDMLNDLNRIVSFCERHQIERSDVLRELGNRLSRRADELETELGAHQAQI